MAHDLNFIQELQDEGLLSNEYSAKTYHFNYSLIGEGNLARYRSLPHYWCSVNQSQLAGWKWLIGDERSVLHPMLCVARRGSEDEFNKYRAEYAQVSSIRIVINCVLSLLNLVNLAVWCRVKTPYQVKQEVPIQLLLVRVISGIDLIGTMAPIFSHWSGTNVRVFSVFHAIILLLLYNIFQLIYRLFYSLTLVIHFITSIYLVEYSHAAQAVFAFRSLRRSQLVVCASVLTVILLSLPELFSYGFAVGDRTSLIIDTYRRFSLSRRTLHSEIQIAIAFILTLLTIILLIVYASKRCCGRSQTSAPSSVQEFESVAYLRQQDEVDNEENGDHGVTIVGVGAAGHDNDANQVFELRTILIIQLVATYVIALLGLGALASLAVSRSFILYQASTWTLELLPHLPMLRMAIMSPILSPMYRSSCRALYVELKDDALGWLRLCRSWRRCRG